ncbi:MAG: hypothetical protein DWQ07_25820 [Chloroflexi bacterium]|nr:MAG: hypothetical protein DWQ07_25820 [Chloroflexota bacterium]
MSKPEIILKGRLDGRQRNLLKSLLNMMYKPSELAKEVGFRKRQIYRVYIPLGMPHERDHRRHIWINGIEFKEWIEQIYPKVKLKSDQSFCLTCKQAVDIIKPKKKKSGVMTYLLSSCPNCGRKLTRIIENDRGKIDKS